MKDKIKKILKEGNFSSTREIINKLRDEYNTGKKEIKVDRLVINNNKNLGKYEYTNVSFKIAYFSTIMDFIEIKIYDIKGTVTDLNKNNKNNKDDLAFYFHYVGNRLLRKHYVGNRLLRKLFIKWKFYGIKEIKVIYVIDHIEYKTIIDY